jgi:hypothetical protein
MRLAVSVIVSALAMSALLLGASLAITALGDSSIAVSLAEGRVIMLRNVSAAFQLSLRAAVLASLDSYAEGLSTLPPSSAFAGAMRDRLESAVDGLSFSSVCAVRVISSSISIQEGAGGGLLVGLDLRYVVSDSTGDWIGVSYSATIAHPLRILHLSSLVSSVHEDVVSSLRSLGNSSVSALASFNGTYVGDSTGAVITTLVLVEAQTSFLVRTWASDSGQAVVLAGGYSYIIEEDSVVPFSRT